MRNRTRAARLNHTTRMWSGQTTRRRVYVAIKHLSAAGAHRNSHLPNGRDGNATKSRVFEEVGSRSRALLAERVYARSSSANQ